MGCEMGDVMGEWGLGEVFGGCGEGGGAGWGGLGVGGGGGWGVTGVLLG